MKRKVMLSENKELNSNLQTIEETKCEPGGLLKRDGFKRMREDAILEERIKRRDRSSEEESEEKDVHSEISWDEKELENEKFGSEFESSSFQSEEGERNSKVEQRSQSESKKLGNLDKFTKMVENMFIKVMQKPKLK